MSAVAIRGLAKSFPGVQALAGIDLDIAAADIHGIVGENGAGKSTLMRILAGVDRPDSGEILFEGSPIRRFSVREAQSRGIAMIHQEQNLIVNLDVASNIVLGDEPNRFGVVDRAAARARASELLRQVGAELDVRRRLGDLSVAERQLVEIAKALDSGSRLLIFDEPTAMLTDHEAEKLWSLIRDLKSRGVTVLYISHRLSEVLALCDRVTVMRDGHVVETTAPSDSTEQSLATAMVGRDLAGVFPPKSAPKSPEGVLQVESLRLTPDGPAVSFDVAPGEVVGLAGLVGAGRTEIAEAVVGLRKAAGGAVRVAGKTLRAGRFDEALQAGALYLSEDRKDTGLFLQSDIAVNVTLADLASFGKLVVNRSALHDAAENWIRQLDIRARGPRTIVGQLSGGNQQKVALAKWLQCRPKVLILDEPTRGVDVGAKTEIYRYIADLANSGMACLVISSEMEELIGLCTRVLVMRAGAVVAELKEGQINEEAMMFAAAGVARAA